MMISITASCNRSSSSNDTSQSSIPLSSGAKLENDLFLAIMFKKLPDCRLALKCLKKSGTELDRIRLKEGHTPLGFCISCNSEEIAAYLIERRIGLNEAGKENLSPIHLAIRYDRPELIKRLLDCPELDVNFDYGFPYHTPLQHCIQSLRDETIIKSIVSHPRFRLIPAMPIIAWWLQRERNSPLASTFSCIDFLINAGFHILAGVRKRKTIQEIFDLLAANPRSSARRALRQIEHSYGKRFRQLRGNRPEMGANLRPLTLRQSARCAIRQTLAQNGKSILQLRLRRQLGLPDCVCQYIWDVSLE